MYLCDEKELGGKVKMSRAEAADFMAKRGKTIDPRYLKTKDSKAQQ